MCLYTYAYCQHSCASAKFDFEILSLKKNRFSRLTGVKFVGFEGYIRGLWVGHQEILILNIHFNSLESYFMRSVRFLEYEREKGAQHVPT